VVDGYTLMFAAFLLAAGALSDRIGAKQTFGFGIALLEHHRGQPQRRNGTRHRPPLLGQLTQRGADKHPNPPVRRPDDRLIPPSLAHRPPLIRPRGRQTYLG